MLLQVRKLIISKKNFNLFIFYKLKNNKEPITIDVQSPVSMQANELNVSSNVATSAPRREKCKYGNKCYR